MKYEEKNRAVGVVTQRQFLSCERQTNFVDSLDTALQQSRKSLYNSL